VFHDFTLISTGWFERKTLPVAGNARNVLGVTTITTPEVALGGARRMGKSGMDTQLAECPWNWD
jgi:hypothetical protein